MDITANSQQKSQLAKLLATENLTVQHAKTQTASFHPITRVLTCPIWEDMSGYLYDLLMGHEVGHALYTPADGWHSAVCDRGQKYKGFLNVVEDPRIEKKIKRKYPGLRSSFLRGYDDLMKRDFFGIKERDINTMAFIDRLNILTKSDYTLEITFTDYEKELVQKVKDCETWNDVLKVTEEIWNYSKDEQRQLKENSDYYYEESSDSDGKGESRGKNSYDEDDLEEFSDQGEPGEPGEPGDGGDEEEGDDDTDSNKINRDKQSQSSDADIEPTCETDEAFRKNEAKLLDEKSRTYFYAEMPTPILKNIVTPVERVQEILTTEFKKQNLNYESVVQTLYEQFRKKNERYIGLLAKEFEMRKAASKFAKAKVSSTGDIDVNKIYKYQLDDSIFKKIMRIPKGKSHGLVLLLDKSGSMASNLSASLEQILILSMFCRKVNIPFTVYGYGNSTTARQEDFPNEELTPCFSQNVDELAMGFVYLREYLNSNMGNAQFTKAVKNILALMSTFKGNWNSKEFYRTYAEALSNTPMTEALVASKPLIEKFRQVNNLDIVNTVIVHDGDADKVSTVITTGRNKEFSTGYMNVYLNDKKNKIQLQIKHDSLNGDGVRWAVSEWLAKTTGTKIIGFFLADENYLKGALRRRLFNAELDAIRKDPENYMLTDTISKYAKILRKEKFLESKNTGYSSFFILPAGNSLSVTDDEFEAPAKVNATNLAKAFMKYNKIRQVNRVMVSRFIGLIAV